MAQLNAQLGIRLKSVIARLKTTPELKDPRKSSWGSFAATYDDGRETTRSRPAFQPAPKGSIALAAAGSKAPRPSEDLRTTELLQPEEDDAKALAKTLHNQADSKTSDPVIRKRRCEQVASTSNTQPQPKPQSTVEPSGGVEIAVNPDSGDRTKRASTPSLGITPAPDNDTPLAGGRIATVQQPRHRGSEPKRDATPNLTQVTLSKKGWRRHYRLACKAVLSTLQKLSSAEVNNLARSLHRDLKAVDSSDSSEEDPEPIETS